MRDPQVLLVEASTTSSTSRRNGLLCSRRVTVWWCWLLCLFVSLTITFGSTAESSCVSNDNNNNNDIDNIINNDNSNDSNITNNATEEAEMKEALRQIVHGYVQSEKAASYETVLCQVNLIVKDTVPAALVEQVVQEAVKDNFVYADRLIHDMLRTVADPDCMTREFDVGATAAAATSTTSDGHSPFNATEAAHVLHKCKVLVLRNVFSPEFLQEYKANFTGFIRGLNNGNIPKTGSTSNNEHYFLHKLDHGRWEVLLPKNLAHPHIVNNRNVLSVLTHERILGQELVLHSFGTALADSGAHAQDWHTDSDYLFGEELYTATGVSQHELPAYAITMMVPLLHMTPEHGPTQFSMGSSNLAGLTEEREQIKLRDESLRPHIYDQPDLEENQDDTDYKYMRTPLITFGDVLLFDYQITHRGGKNVSPDLRAMLYGTYSRFWYMDKGFEDDDDDDDEEDEEEEDDVEYAALYKQLTRTARFAIPEDFEEDEEYDDVLSADWKEYANEEGSLESLGKFKGKVVLEDE